MYKYFTEKLDSILLSEEKKRLFLNFIYLFSLQGVNYILPLLTLPYLIRVLGPDKFGLYVFAQAFIQYMVVFTDYGFNLSATREISINRDDLHKTSEIFSTTMVVRFVLMAICFLILTILVLSFDKFRANWLFYFLAFGMVIGNLLFPIWFFMGLEKMKYITYLNILAKFIFTLLIFIFIRNPNDFMFVPLINSLGFIVAGILAIRIIYKHFKVRFFIPELKTCIHSFKDSTQFFLSSVSTIMYTSNNSFVLGLFTSNPIVGFYGAAEKLSFALKGIYYPLSDNLYPFMTKARNIGLYKKIFILAVLFNTILCVFTFSFSNQIINIIFGSGHVMSANVFKIFSIIAIFSVPSTLLGYPLLGAYGKTNVVNFSYVAGSIIHIIGLSLLAIFSKINIYSVTAMVLITEVMILVLRIYAATKMNFKQGGN